MVRTIVVVCAVALMSGCASTAGTTYTKDVAYLDENGETKIKTVEYTVPAPTRKLVAPNAQSICGITCGSSR